MISPDGPPPKSATRAMKLVHDPLHWFAPPTHEQLAAPLQAFGYSASRLPTSVQLDVWAK